VIDGYEFGYARDEQDMWCIRKVGVQARMLCGRKVGFVPVVQPARPTNVHRDCLEAMYGATNRGESPTGYGTCPACGGSAPVSGGRMQAHGEVRVNGDGRPYESETSCLGVNMRPRRQR